jgi:hypothetical protein
MATISNDPKIGYIYDETGDSWHPLVSSGVVPHQHAASAIPGFQELNNFLVSASSSFLTGTAASAVFLSFAKQETGSNKTFLNSNLIGASVISASVISASVSTVFGNQPIASFRNRNIYIDTGSPSGGSDGDIWIRYTP